MASSFQLFIMICLLITFLSISKAKMHKPKSLVLPVSKDASTLQYIAHLHLGTPHQPTNLVLDLGGRYLWMDCETKYNSSTYKSGHCGSAPCSLAKATDCFYCFSTPPRLGCSSNTCRLDPQNTITGVNATDELATDIIYLPSTTDASKLVAKVANFVFSCSQRGLVDGLARGAKGMAGLGRTQISLPSQLSSSRKFAMCLPSTSKAKGVIVFGDAPYAFYPDYNKSKLIDMSKSFSYTSLYINPVSTAKEYYEGRSSAEYFIGVKSILINKKRIPIKSDLLSINDRGYGGIKISTVNPYTILESSIYKAFTETFTKELKAMNIAKVAPVAPFTECYGTKFMGFTPEGVDVPGIRFVFQNKKIVFWELIGANSMVQISRETVCLAFLDGGTDPTTSIVIGAHQLENYLLHFDLAASKLGFSSSLLSVEAGCSNFRF